MLPHDPKPLRALLRETLVTEQSGPRPPLPPLEASPAEGAQHLVVQAAIGRSLAKKVTWDQQNVLAMGHRARNDSAGYSSQYPSSAVHVLNQPCWELLRTRIGSGAMEHLLCNATVLSPLSNDSYQALTGPMPALAAVRAARSAFPAQRVARGRQGPSASQGRCGPSAPLQPDVALEGGKRKRPRLSSWRRRLAKKEAGSQSDALGTESPTLSSQPPGTQAPFGSPPQASLFPPSALRQAGARPPARAMPLFTQSQTPSHNAQPAPTRNQATRAPAAPKAVAGPGPPPSSPVALLLAEILGDEAEVVKDDTGGRAAAARAAPPRPPPPPAPARRLAGGPPSFLLGGECRLLLAQTLRRYKRCSFHGILRAHFSNGIGPLPNGSNHGARFAVSGRDDAGANSAAGPAPSTATFSHTPSNGADPSATPSGGGSSRHAHGAVTSQWRAQERYGQLMRQGARPEAVAVWLRSICKHVLPGRLVGGKKNWKMFSRNLALLLALPPNDKRSKDLTSVMVQGMRTSECNWMHPHRLTAAGQPPRAAAGSGPAGANGGGGEGGGGGVGSALCRFSSHYGGPSGAAAERRRQRDLRLLLHWLAHRVLLPLSRRLLVSSRTTVSGVHRFYWPRGVWLRMQRLAMRRAKRTLLSSISKEAGHQMLNDKTRALGAAKLKLVPKPGAPQHPPALTRTPSRQTSPPRRSSSATASHTPTPPTPAPRAWPLQDIVLLRCFCARFNHPFIAPSHLHYPHYSNTVVRPLRNIRRPTDPSFVCHTPYNIDNGNIV